MQQFIQRGHLLRTADLKIQCNNQTYDKEFKQNTSPVLCIATLHLPILFWENYLLKKNDQTFHAVLIITINSPFFFSFILPHLRVFPDTLGTGIAGQGSTKPNSLALLRHDQWYLVLQPHAILLLVKEHKGLSHTHFWAGWIFCFPFFPLYKIQNNFFNWWERCHG